MRRSQKFIRNLSTAANTPIGPVKVKPIKIETANEISLQNAPNSLFYSSESLQNGFLSVTPRNKCNYTAYNIFYQAANCGVSNIESFINTNYNMNDIEKNYLKGNYEKCIEGFNEYKDCNFDYLPKQYYLYLLDCCLRISVKDDVIMSIFDDIEKKYKDDEQLLYYVIKVLYKNGEYELITHYHEDHKSVFTKKLDYYSDIFEIILISAHKTEDISLLNELIILTNIYRRCDLISIVFEHYCKNNYQEDVVLSEYEKYKDFIVSSNSYSEFTRYLCNKHDLKKLLEVYNEMIDRKICINFSTYYHLFACSLELEYEESDKLTQIYNDILKNSFLPSKLYDLLIEYFKGVKVYSEIFAIFDKLFIYDVNNNNEIVISNAMNTILSISKQNKYYEQCLTCFQQYMSRNYIITGQILSNFTNFCKYSNNQNKLLSLYQKINNKESEQMVECDASFYCAIIRIAIEYKDFQQIVIYEKEIKENNIEISSELYSVLFNYAKGINDKSKFLELLNEVENKPEILSNTIIFASLLECCRVFQLYDLSLKYYKIFCNSNLLPNKSLYTTMMSIFKAQSLWNDAVELFKKMKELEGPNNAIYGSMIAFCKEEKNYKYARELYDDLLKNKIQPSSALCSSLLNTYKDCKLYNEAEKLYNDIIKQGIKGSSTFHATMIAIYGETEEYDKAFDLYKSLVSKHIEIGNSIYCSLLHICESIKDINKANFLYNTLLSNHLNPNTHVFSSYMSVCLATNHIDKLYELLDDMKKFNVEADSYVNDVLQKAEIII